MKSTSPVNSISNQPIGFFRSPDLMWFTVHPFHWQYMRQSGFPRREVQPGEHDPSASPRFCRFDADGRSWFSAHSVNKTLHRVGTNILSQRVIFRFGGRRDKTLFIIHNVNIWYLSNTGQLRRRGSSWCHVCLLLTGAQQSMASRRDCSRAVPVPARSKAVP